MFDKHQCQFDFAARLNYDVAFMNYRKNVTCLEMHVRKNIL